MNIRVPRNIGIVLSERIHIFKGNSLQQGIIIIIIIRRRRRRTGPEKSIQVFRYRREF
jgi:hypothetical protein